MSEVYELKHPFTKKRRVAGGEVTEEEVVELEIRRLNGGDMRWLGANRTKPDMALQLIARVTGLQNLDVDQIDAEDVAGISEMIEGFLPASLKTGADG